MDQSLYFVGNSTCLFNLPEINLAIFSDINQSIHMCMYVYMYVLKHLKSNPQFSLIARSYNVYSSKFGGYIFKKRNSH